MCSGPATVFCLHVEVVSVNLAAGALTCIIAGGELRLYISGERDVSPCLPVASLKDAAVHLYDDAEKQLNN